MNIRNRILSAGAGVLTVVAAAPLLMCIWPGIAPQAMYALVAAAGGALGWLLCPALTGAARRATARLTRCAAERPLPELLLGLGGVLAGLVAARFVCALMQPLLTGAACAALGLLLGAVLCMAGWTLIGGRWRELVLSAPAQERAPADAAIPAPEGVPKVLDTSVLVDGRIFDICRTGFLEGPLVLPQFILEELQHIADSPDALRRNRGRRGLDIVARIRKELDIPFLIDDDPVEDAAEVDIKLLRLTQRLGGRVVTNDFNLNKVAEVSGVSVLNINELAGALKPVLLPGEELSVQIVREGKEMGQGVAFMEDGTMIVVENGRRFIGQSVMVCVNTVLQTAAGRMIFARMREKAAV